MFRRPGNGFTVRSGLTLLELVVVMAILAALAGILIPLMPGLVQKSSTTAGATNLDEIDKAMQLYASQNGGFYPDQLDSLADSSGDLLSYVPNGFGSWFQQGTAANVTADYGTLGGMSPLLDAGINYVVQPIAQPTGTVGDWSPTYFPYGTNATTPPTPAAITQLAYVQPSVVQNLFGAGLPLDGRYVIFGLGKYSTIVGKGMAQAPVYFDSTQGKDPDHAYSRFGVIFQTAGAGGAPLITARYLGSVAMDYYGLKNTDQMFYQNQLINK